MPRQLDEVPGPTTTSSREETTSSRSSTTRCVSCSPSGSTSSRVGSTGSVYAWALMTNHFHLVLQIGDAGLSDGMRELNTRLRAGFERAVRPDQPLPRRAVLEHAARDRAAPVREHPLRALEPGAGRGRRPSGRLALDELPRDRRARSPAASCSRSASCSSTSARRRHAPGPPSALSSPRARDRCRQPWNDGDGNPHVSVYSGPEPPSGGVRRPPLAVIAPHWTQFDGVDLDLDQAVLAPAPTS